MTPWQNERWATAPTNDGRNFAAAHRWAVAEARPLCFGAKGVGGKLACFACNEHINACFLASVFTFSKDPVSHIAHCMTAMWASREALRDRIATLEAALKRQVDNVERWMETGFPADAEESRSIYEQMVSALREAKADA